MPKLSILEKNAYINILIKDNGILGYLAYMDYNANREYILSDYTDINSLRFLLDDNIFTKDFWFEYFDNLENVFNWNIVDKDKSSIFTFRRFKEEGDGISGVRVQIDDNQEFFREIFDSVRDFSNDVSLRVVDDKYMNSILEGVLRRMNLDDLMLVDMDLFHFSIFRVKAEYEKGKPTGKLSPNTRCAAATTLPLVLPTSVKIASAFKYGLICTRTFSVACTGNANTTRSASCTASIAEA